MDISPQNDTSLPKMKQMHSYVRRAFQQLRVDIRIKFCDKCQSFNMCYKQELNCLTPFCDNFIPAGVSCSQIPCAVRFYCPDCSCFTNLNLLANIGFFMCLECFYRPKFGTNCGVYLLPSINQIRGCKINLPYEGRLIQQQPLSCVYLDPEDYFCSALNFKQVYFPSKAISPLVFDSLISRKRKFLVTDVLVCAHCFTLNEFEYTRKSLCLCCGCWNDTREFASFQLGVRRYVTAVSFAIECDRCGQSSDLAGWTSSGNFLCPQKICSDGQEVGGRIVKIIRTLEPCQISTGLKHSVLPLGANEWFYKVPSSSF